MDERLATNSSMENISLSIRILDKIWFPDTVFYNGLKSYLHMVPTPNRFIRIGRNGSVYLSQRYCCSFVFVCLIEITSWKVMSGKYLFITEGVKTTRWCLAQWHNNHTADTLIWSPILAHYSANGPNSCVFFCSFYLLLYVGLASKEQGGSKKNISSNIRFDLDGVRTRNLSGTKLTLYH